jgi:hypothetical protein
VRISSIVPEVGSAAGGQVITISGSGFSSGATVTFAAVAATGVTVNSSTQITTTSPRFGGSTPQNVDVVVTNPNATADRLAAGFDYEPAPTTTYVSSNFEDGTLGAFGTGGSRGTVVNSTDYAHSGTHSIKCLTGGTTEAQLQFGYPNPTNPMLSNANGLYQHWYQMVLAETITNSAGGQIKMLLDRGAAGGAGWLMNGIGSQFNSNPDGEYRMYADPNVTKLPGTATPVVFQPLQWYEIETWFHRSGGLGYVKVWINGRLLMNTSSSIMGSDLASDKYIWRFGIDYQQGNTGQTVMYLDDAAAADGFLEPVP